MVDILSVFTQKRQAAIFHIRKDDAGMITPLGYWERSPSDRDFISAFSKMLEALPEDAYAVFNGVAHDKEKDRYENPIQHSLADAGGLFCLVVSPKQEIALESALAAIEAQGLLDTSMLEIWPRIRAELDRDDDLSVRVMAFLQGVSELRNPEADRFPMRNLRIPLSDEATLIGWDEE